jgi:hypothetical protein
MIKDLIGKLGVDPDKDMKRLLNAIQNNQVSILPTGMKKHFEIAKLKPAGFKEHDTVLGISIGGSNTKVILASMKAGRMVVHHLSARMNPSSKTFYTDYFDNLLFEDAQVRDFMNHSEGLCLGISIAVPVIDGVPYHKNKIPTIDGLIARDYEKDAPAHHLRENMFNYLKEKGVNCKSFFCQFDCIVANHGGASLCELEPDEKTLLLVCGTGLATAIEEHTVSIGMVDAYDSELDDEMLLPFDLTEGHQYQYAVAGKGLYALMARAIGIRSREAGSKLRYNDPDSYFKTAYDTRTVVEIWENTLGCGIGAKAEEIFKAVGTEAFSELKDIAAAIVERAITGLANCAVAAICADSAGNNRRHTIFFEGSIALNNNILPRVKNEILRRIGTSQAFDELNFCRPQVPFMDKALLPVLAAGRSVSEKELQQVDLTVKGVITSVISEDIINSYR